MPAASTTLRALAASAVASLLVTGCQSLDDAGRVIGRADLVNELAARMDRALELTYSAEYQLPGGKAASIAQVREPDPKAAYTYPGGKVTVSREALAECDTASARPVCTLIPPPVPTNKPSVTVFTEAKERGMVTPPMVINMLTTAALDPEAVIEQTDTTLAGHHATCVEVQQSADPDVSRFTACVTTEGILGSFQGEIDGKPMEVALSRYRPTAEEAAFDLPAGAGVVDRRPAAA